MKTRNFYDHILTFRDRGETKMKLPKKLEPWTRIEPGTGTLQDKINEIIDYLSDKEGGEVKTGIPMGKHPIATKDCSVCKAKKGWIHLYEECTPKVACKSCGAEMIETEHYIGSKKLRSDFNCSKCGLSDLDKPQLKEESPKEDEWDKETEKQWQYKLQTGFIDVSELKWFINRNFVSKVKIKERINQCGYVQHGRFIDKEDLLESLGLEEL